MRVIETLNEIRMNIKTLDKYLDSKTDPVYSFAIGLVEKGICFVAAKRNGAYRFYPSRFVGYADNCMDTHLGEHKDGRDTNRAISAVLGSNPRPNPTLDNLYREYCESLGFIANERGTFGVERKYWEI